MSDIKIQKNKDFRTNANEKLEGLVSSDWLAFLDAVGRVEGNDTYNINNGVGFYGIYQQGNPVVNGDLDFFNNYGDILDISTMSDLQKNPIAQELAGIMEFSGEPDATSTFSSKYTYVKSLTSLIPREHFNALMDETFTVNWTKNGETFSNTFTVNKASISGAAHLIGQGGVAKALEAMYDKAFVNGELVNTTISLDPDNTAFADGNHVAFSTYMEIFDDYNVDSLIAANGKDDFNTLYGELLSYRKEKITTYINEHDNITLENDKDYTKDINTTITNFSTAAVTEKGMDNIILAGKDVSNASNQNDLIISLDNGIAKTLKGGQGDDTYVSHASDTINDSDNTGKIYFDATLLSGVKHKVSEGVYEDEMFSYTKTNGTLVISQKEDASKSVTVENWDAQTQKALDIELSEEKVNEVDNTNEVPNSILPESINNYLEQFGGMNNENINDMNNIE